MMPQGLTPEQAAERLKKDGPNELSQRSTISARKIFLAQFNSPLVFLLFGATGLSFLLGDTFEGMLILAIVLLNSLLGFAQEYRAERALEALKHIAVSVVRVIRGGVQSEIDSRLLVVGDYIFLEEGNKIPADATLIESVHLEVDEAALTGESLPVAKDAIKEETSSLFLGTSVVHGRGIACITATGIRTKFGKIASELAGITKEETPLEKKLATVAQQLGIAALVAGIIISLIGYSQHIPFVSILLTAVSLAVAAVPEGLPAVITVTLAIGTQRMARKRSILRKLTAIESLGGVTIIATDKTGTLTRNEMRVTKIWSTNERTLIETGIICNNASLAPVNDRSSFDVIGDKTEGALLLLAQEKKVDIPSVRQSGTLVEEFAFDPTSKTMSVVWRVGQITHVHTKGSPESILARCTMTQKEKNAAIAQFELFAREGLRCLGLATKRITWKKQKREAIERDLTFLGFVGISDPPRTEVRDAIAQARMAGIATVMITGDNELTAFAIAKHIGLMQQGDEVITGQQFAALSSEEKRTRMAKIRVFARTTPEQKLEIVRLLQKAGHIVAVTGDGVNDALALKQAHVGIAMGITGTDVAKESADMVITDDNYSTIVRAIEEGRIIYENMKASIKYLVGSNIGEILSLLVGALLGWPFILLPIQILYINLITDGLPALALALNNKHQGIMRRSPRTETQLFTRFDIRWLLEVSVLTAATTLAAFWIGYRSHDIALARTLAFIIIALAQQFIFLDIIGGERSILSPHVLRNKWSLVPVGTFALQLILLPLPWFDTIFKTVWPGPDALLMSIVLCTGMVLVAEIRKYVQTHGARDYQRHLSQ